MGPAGLHRGDRRLDHHRGRAAALHGLWPAAHGRQRLARSRRRRSPPRWRPSSMVYFVVFGAGHLVPAPAVRASRPSRTSRGRRRASRSAPPASPRRPAARRRHGAGAPPAGGVTADERSTCRSSGPSSSPRPSSSTSAWTASTSASASCSRSSAGRTERDVMVNTVAPVWDGNETWLVLGGGGLFAVFPLAYATHPAGALHAADPDAAGAGLPRRRLRDAVPRRDARAQRCGGTASFSWGSYVGGLLPGHLPRRLGAGHPGARAAPMRAAGGTG